MTEPYGSSVTGELAKVAACAAIEEARRHGWTMAVAIVDTAGQLVYFEKMDDTQLGSVVVCQEKASSAARFKRPTRAFQDMLKAGNDGLRVLRISGAVPVAGGVPLIVKGRIVGAVGVSGGTSDEDEQCAYAGARALNGAD
jgi:uncharacterized protein GlcG (DUF336 family)